MANGAEMFFYKNPTLVKEKITLIIGTSKSNLIVCRRVNITPLAKSAIFDLDSSVLG